MFINTLVKGKIIVKVLIDTTSKYNTISKHLFDKLESDHRLKAKISFGYSSKTHVHYAKIVIDSMSILLFDENFNKASSIKNNLSKSIESKPDRPKGSLLCNIPPIHLLSRRLNDNVSKNKSKKNNVKYSTDASSNSDTSDSNSSNFSTSSSEIEVTHAYKTRVVKKYPIRKRKVKGELNKKYSKQTELLKALGINILKGHPNSLASNITISELENCYECNEKILLNLLKAFITLVCGHRLYSDCLEKSNRDKQKTCLICFINNEGTALAEVQDVDMSEVEEDEGEEISNLTGMVNKLSVDSDKAIPRSETKSIEPDKVQGLIKELSIPSELIDDNDRENKSKESKPITLLQLYYNANWAEKC
ncbi:3614_t:CDS:2, partial [Scutellospora calospora]